MVKSLVQFIFCLFITTNTIAQCDSASALLWENFEGYSPANGPTGWITKGVDYTQTGFAGFNSINRIGLNATTDSIITKPVICPSSIQFYWRASGTTSNWGMAVQYSTNLNTWTTLDSVVTTGSGSSTAYTLKSIAFPNLNLLPPFAVYVRFNLYRRTSGAMYIDNLCMQKGVCHAIASELQFTNSTNNCVPSGIPFSVTACATDNNGYVDTTFNGLISLSLGSGNGLLGGLFSANAISGCAQFNAVTFSGSAPLSLNASGGTFSSSSPLTSLDIQTTCPNVDTLIISTYNLLNFPEGGVYSLGGACSPQELGPKRWDTLKAIVQYIKPDIMIVQELQTEAGIDSVLAKSFNINGITKYAKAPYIPNRSTANKNYNNELIYNTDKLVLLQTNTLGTSIRDCGQYILYCKDPMLNVHNDTTFIDMYSIHTKAKGLSAAQATLDSIQRNNDCQLVMDSIRYRQSTERNAIIGGDMNLYTSAEGAYQAFITGLYKFNDPVNMPGAWESNFAFAALHTQAARSSSRLSLECGARGGLDSRLDFLLSSDPIMTGTKHMQYIPNTYQAFGNSGNLFNKSVDTSTNSSGIPPAVLRSLANMSDHIPVIMKVAVVYPNLTSLQMNEAVFLSGTLIQNKAILNWNLTLEEDIQLIELLEDNQVIFSQENTNKKGFEKQNVKTGAHVYKLRIKTKSGLVKMSNEVKLYQAENANYEISPNPFISKIIISNIAKVKVSSITISDVRGIVLIQKTNVSVNNNSVELATDFLPKGIYFVGISDGQLRKMYKVVK